MLNEKQINIRIKAAEESIKRQGQYINYRASDILDFEDIKRICAHFKGRCHAKINYFIDGRAPYQCFVIQTCPFDLSRQGRMIYSEGLF